MLTLNRPLVFLDLEATGTDPQEARIIQIGALRFDPKDQPPSEGTPLLLNRLVDPQEPIPEQVAELTGIDDADVKDADVFAAVADEVRRMIQDADLAAYNGLRYDIPLLEAEFERVGQPFPGPSDRVVVDPYALEKALVSWSLGAVYERYTGREMVGAHSAIVDVKAAKTVLRSQISQHIGDDVTPADLSDLARGDYLDDGRKLKQTDQGVEMCFGKHSGKTLQWVHDNDPTYFDWMYSTIDGLAPHIDDALSA
jgi:DNA polymerase-3 subunit epsilon